MPDEASHSAFVTGGTGFVGSHLVERLLQEEFGEVRCLVRQDPGYLKGLPIKIVPGTIGDQNALRKGVEGVDYVFHVAAVTRATEWAAFESANIEGTLHLLEAVKAANPDVRNIMITSSLAAVGRCYDKVATEKAPLRPVSRYGESKALMERRLHPYQDVLPIVVVRPPAVYGPRETDIFTFFKSIARGFCPIVGAGDTPSLSLVHVDDLVQGMLAAVLSNVTTGKTYFLGSPRNYSWYEIRDAAAHAFKRRVLTIRVPPGFLGPIGWISEFAGRLRGVYPPLNREKANEIRHACTMCDSSLAGSDFGYAPGKRLEDGISETIEWYRKEGWL